MFLVTYDATHMFQYNQAPKGNFLISKETSKLYTFITAYLCKHPEGVRQACFKSGPRAKSGPQQNFVRPTA